MKLAVCSHCQLAGFHAEGCPLTSRRGPVALAPLGERDAIVAWLRALAVTRGRWNPGDLADHIERGEHHK